MNKEISFSNLEVNKIQKYLKTFIDMRGWEKYRTPKNLAMALVVESAELMEIFQWIEGSTSIEIKNNKEIYQNVKDEMADVLSYLFQLAQVLDIDINEAFWEKTKKNELKHQLKSTEN